MKRPRTFRAKTGFVNRTIRQLSRVLEYEFYSERYVHNGMLLQCINPTVKLLISVGFMILAAAASNIVVLIALAVIALVYAKLSGLVMKDFVRRTWAYIPVIVLIFSLPGATGIFIQGTPLITVLRPGTFGIKDGLYFTASGLYMAVRLALRPGVSLSFALLLLQTTEWSRITGALVFLHVPSIFVYVLNMAYRYIFIMVETANAMMEARYLRTVGKLTTKENRKFIGHSVGYLFLRSLSISETVYDAMVCRGFSGRQIIHPGTGICSGDVLFIISNLLIVLIILVGGRLF